MDTQSGAFPGVGICTGFHEKWGLFLVRREVKDVGYPHRSVRAAEIFVLLERGTKGPPLIRHELCFRDITRCSSHNWSTTRPEQRKADSRRWRNLSRFSFPSLNILLKPTLSNTSSSYLGNFPHGNEWLLSRASFFKPAYAFMCWFFVSSVNTFFPFGQSPCRGLFITTSHFSFLPLVEGSGKPSVDLLIANNYLVLYSPEW